MSLENDDGTALESAEVLVQLVQYESKETQQLSTISLAIFSQKDGTLLWLAFISYKQDEEGRLGPEQLVAERLLAPPEPFAPNRAGTCVGCFEIISLVYSQLKVKGNKFVIIPSTFAPGIRASFRVTVYSDARIRMSKVTEEDADNSDSE